VLAKMNEPRLIQSWSSMRVFFQGTRFVVRGAAMLVDFWVFSDCYSLARGRFDVPVRSAHEGKIELVSFTGFRRKSIAPRFMRSTDS